LLGMGKTCGRHAISAKAYNPKVPSEFRWKGVRGIIKKPAESGYFIENRPK
jgi:hypothetical protein